MLLFIDNWETFTIVGVFGNGRSQMIAAFLFC